MYLTIRFIYLRKIDVFDNLIVDFDRDQNKIISWQG